MNLPERITKNLTAQKLFPRSGKILVAISGGMDSMVLLHLLRTLAPARGWQLAVAHFNHQLRGRASDADETFVRVATKKLDLNFLAGRGDVNVHATRKKISVEMAARELRHAFLARTARRVRATHIALAHHADDQVELFFLRLLRGSGGEGLAGMKWISPSPADAKLQLMRPLLHLSKAELETYARENKIHFREDASNHSSDFLRNRIRCELLPLLREHYQPALNKTVLRAMEIIGTEAEFVTAAAREDARLTTANFAKSPVALQRRRLQSQLLALGVKPGFELIEWLRAHPGEAVTLDARRAVTCDAAGQAQLQPGARKRTSKFLIEQHNLNLAARTVSKAIFAGRKCSWAIQSQLKFSRPKSARGQEFFDADAVGGKIILRHWRAGDRFQPIGMASPVKLQDLFVNAKIPAAQRRALVVATTARGEIFWVEGLRIGERFKLTPATRRKLRWNWS